MFTVAVVAEQPIAQAGMEKLAADSEDLRVTAAVATAAQLLECDERYDVVMLDLSGWTADATEVIARVAGVGRVLVTSDWDNRLTLLAAIRAGARGCVSRFAEQRDVREALRVIVHGGFYLCPLLVDLFQSQLAAHRDEDPNGLAPREVETLRWIALGYTNSQIATRMGLTPATVNTYAKRIRAKLNVTNKAELTRMAIELGHVVSGRPGAVFDTAS